MGVACGDIDTATNRLVNKYGRPQVYSAFIATTLATARLTVSVADLLGGASDRLWPSDYLTRSGGPKPPSQPQAATSHKRDRASQETGPGISGDRSHGLLQQIGD